MKIVVLDGYAVNPGDLSWEALESLGETIVYPRTMPEERQERMTDAVAVLTNKVVLDRKLLAACPRLRYVGVLATGYNVVDLDACRDLGIAVTNIPAYSTASVAQSVFSHILNWTNQTAIHAGDVRYGGWCESEDFSYVLTPQIELAGKTLGIYGFGRIGRAVAALGKAFGMRVLVATRSAQPPEEGVVFCEPEQLFAESDFLTLHCPLTPETQGLINKESLSMMKPTAMVVNTGRGGLVDEQALADALNNGRLGAAGLDVLSSEPPDTQNPLLQALNCFITPHIAWATREARERLMDTAFANLSAYQKSEKLNRLD